jgi:hypothetical protein
MSDIVSLSGGSSNSDRLSIHSLTMPDAGYTDFGGGNNGGGNASSSSRKSNVFTLVLFSIVLTSAATLALARFVIWPAVTETTKAASATAPAYSNGSGTGVADDQVRRNAFVFPFLYRAL